MLALSYALKATSFLILSFLPVGNGHCFRENSAKKLTAFDASHSDRFGSAVDVDGNSLIVGSPRDRNENGFRAGAAYVYKNGIRGWTHQAKFVADERQPKNNYFGRSVAIHGDEAIVGLRSMVDGLSNAGSAYVFKNVDPASLEGNWSKTDELTASDVTAGDDFAANALALYSDTLVIGMHRDDNENGVDAGSVFVFMRDTDGSWTEVLKLHPHNDGPSNFFGWSAALDGDDTLVVGAPTNGDNQGVAYVFKRIDDGGWSEQAKLLPNEDGVDDSFGSAVAIDGNTIVIGAYRNDNENGSHAGAVYIFTKNNNAWSEEAKLIGDGGPFSNFGFSLAIYGDTVIAGARREDDERGKDVGAVYVFTWDSSSGEWSRQDKLHPTGSGARVKFGHAVAFDGRTLVVGALEANDSGHFRSGTAYVFANTAPIATADADAELVRVGMEVTIMVVIDDPDDTFFTVFIDWDDGTAVDSSSDMSTEISLSHAYAEAGVYTVKVTVADDSCFSLPVRLSITVYDPYVGFVTGGGWMNSVPGAYKLDETATGKANFGFVSRYQMGAAVPNGNALFKFRAGDFKLNLVKFEWLVIRQGETNDAQFKGWCTVNDMPSPNGETYNCMVLASNDDSTCDTLRIKVWYSNCEDCEEILIYDNGPNQCIDQGSIQVHS